jgi:hypothetical protein
MRKRKYTKEFLTPFVKQSTNYTNLLNNLGLKVTGGVHRLITMRIKEYGIDTSHFTGCIWNKGKTKHSNQILRIQSLKVRTPHEQVFCQNSGYGSSKLFGRLIELGWMSECSTCKLTEWLDRPIRFHVDHKNGNHTDNRLDNLRFLCPNCHQQTETWGAKNKG